MQMRRPWEFVVYLLAFAGFGAVVLWAEPASFAAFGALAGLAVVLILALLFAGGVRRPVLLVGEPDAEVRALDHALERSGYEVRTCAGPTNRPCPVLAGGTCPIEERPAIAVIVRAPDASGPFPPCARALHVPDLTVEEAVRCRPVYVGTSARVGSGDPDEVIRAMEVLLAG
jgi:hypothetical protein